MINTDQKKLLLDNITELLELPESAYEKAKKRYDDIGEWLGRGESLCKDNNPHVFPQGSFRLGTAIRPLDEKEEYDLDLACKLCEGINKDSHTQEELKKRVGYEIEKYRVDRSIKAPIEEKHRCWTLEYADDLSFHMDIVPCIPELELKRKSINEAMIQDGTEQSIAEAVSELTVSITDDRHDNYTQIHDDWNISNPEGYAKWFTYRMKLAERLLHERAQSLKTAIIDELPTYKWKTPLQLCIQLLKRHRDQMFKDDTDVKPISIIITTLAARAYKGESDIESALQNILSQMKSFVDSGSSVVSNPVNPEENFADRWSMPGYSHLKLKDNFGRWVMQAKNDFDLLASTDDTDFITEQAAQKFSVKMNSSDLRNRLGIMSAPAVVIPKEHNIKDTAKPWSLKG